MHKINPSRDGEHFIVIGKFNQRLVDEIKDRIPPSGREWNPTAKFWKVKKKWHATLVQIVDDANAAAGGSA